MLGIITFRTRLYACRCACFIVDPRPQIDTHEDSTNLDEIGPINLSLPVVGLGNKPVRNFLLVRIVDVELYVGRSFTTAQAMSAIKPSSETKRYFMGSKGYPEH
jgi:hypothetical protein